MPFRLIKGTFHVLNYSPDGDSIRFQPNDRAFFQGLSGPPPKFNPRGHTQLRIEAIDALETHYNASGGGSQHQPLALAHLAMDALLDYAGITQVVWNQAHSSVLSARDGTPGFILTRSVEKNQRPVAFVFSGDMAAQDGSDVFLTPELLTKSFNYISLAKGFSYPTFYTGLFSDLREALAAQARAARAASAGIHALDRTNEGFDAASMSSITETHAILPKLFRRLADYMSSTGTSVGFKETLEQSREPVLDLRTQNFTHFDTFVLQAAGSTTVAMDRLPEELVFDEMPTRPADAFGMVVERFALEAMGMARALRV
jgi:hypothetical protein